jgi:GntR family transcriptional regulator
VAKAYQQFQIDGLVEVQRGVGMIVAKGAAERLRRAEKAHFLCTEWPAVREKIARLGITTEELIAQCGMALQ